jgi:hypothetical protein
MKMQSAFPKGRFTYFLKIYRVLVEFREGPIQDPQGHIR